MSERTFTIEMIDMDLADLDTDEFLGLTPTYLRSILLELKRCYQREDELIEALRIIRDDLDEEIAKAHFPNDKVAWQIRNFAHDASQ